MAKVLDNKNLIDGMSAEEIREAIAGNGVVLDGFISKVVEQNGNRPMKIWVGGMAQYLALAEKESDVLYLIEDDSFVDEVNTRLTRIERALGIV